MKILMYAPIYPPTIGGPATQCVHLCRTLLEKGDIPVILTTGTRFSRKIEEDGYAVYRYPWAVTHTPLDKVLRWFIFLPFVLYVLLRERPWVVHAHAVNANSLMLGVVCKMFRIPSVIKFAGDWVWETLSTNTLHAPDLEALQKISLRARLLLKIESFGVGMYTAQWAPSRFRVENIRKLLGRKANVIYIPNCLILPDRENFSRTGHSGVTVISASRFVPQKRPHVVAEIFDAVAGPEDRLLLVGSGLPEYVAQVQKVVDVLPRKNQITLLGRLSSKELYPLFANADVYVSASLEEGLPNVFIEAMHFGLPILATDVGGCGEMVTEGKSGFLVPPDDLEKMKERLRTLLQNAQLRKDMSTRAIEESRSYNLAHIVDDFREMYSSLLAGNKI